VKCFDCEKLDLLVVTKYLTSVLCLILPHSNALAVSKWVPLEQGKGVQTAAVPVLHSRNGGQAQGILRTVYQVPREEEGISYDRTDSVLIFDCLKKSVLHTPPQLYSGEQLVRGVFDVTSTVFTPVLPHEPLANVLERACSQEGEAPEGWTVVSATPGHSTFMQADLKSRQGDIATGRLKVNMGGDNAEIFGGRPIEAIYDVRFDCVSESMRIDTGGGYLDGERVGRMGTPPVADSIEEVFFSDDAPGLLVLREACE
jgi:hypothetical protein